MTEGVVVGNFQILILALYVATGLSGLPLRAIEAFEAPPVNQAAQHYRAVAFYLFLASSGLLLIAAVADTVAKARLLSEVFGWSGFGCLHVCFFCGLRYASVNTKPKSKDYDWDLA